jgi:Cu(I)/Ag(I) efflux system membrane fusion protein/cobalt-zinc-cadmium efflux system membrane fusion protein
MSVRHFAWTTVAILVALAAGWWGRGLTTKPATPSQLTADTKSQGPCPGGAAALYWKAPMDPSFVRDAPGKSPMGMALVPECPTPGARESGRGITIDAATIQNMGVRTVFAERRDLARVVRAVGRIAYDERRVTHVHTKVQGWVENLLVDFVGQRVERDEPLLEIYSPELVATQEELVLATRYRAATESSPFDDVRDGGQSLFEATKNRLALWDIPTRDIERLVETGEVERTLTLYAPASGVVTRLGVRAGMEVSLNTNLYTIADLSRVWVLANVYEYELPWLEIGQKAAIELGYMPDLNLEGTLSYISPFLDPQTRTAEVRLELDNSDGRLKPEMFANVLIRGAPRSGVLAIPSESIIRSGTRTLAVVALPGGRFEPREVELGLDGGDGWYEVRSGIADGDEIVVSSQFLIDSESNLREAVRKLMSPTRAEHPPTHANGREE